MPDEEIPLLRGVVRVGDTVRRKPKAGATESPSALRRGSQLARLPVQSMNPDASDMMIDGRSSTHFVESRR